jgi:hypothetical protein
VERFAGVVRSEIRVRVEDLPFGLPLSNQANWDQNRRSARRFLTGGSPASVLLPDRPWVSGGAWLAGWASSDPHHATVLRHRGRIQADGRQALWMVPCRVAA